MGFCQLTLTCADSSEAEKIANSLLSQRLVACVKTISIESRFLWNGNVKAADETMLVMISRTELFEKVDRVISGLHSYDVYVLEAVTITRVNRDAQEWMEQSLVDGKAKR